MEAPIPGVSIGWVRWVVSMMGVTMVMLRQMLGMRCCYVCRDSAEVASRSDEFQSVKKIGARSQSLQERSCELGEW